MTGPLPDVRAEAARIADAIDGSGLELRLAGGLAIAMHCPSVTREPLARLYKDIDLAGRARDRTRIGELVESLGYAPQREFNLLNGATRLMFVDTASGRDVDVFLDRIVGCHTIQLGERLSLAGRTLSLADLLLSKLQIVETTHKDLVDIVGLLADHELGDGEGDIDLGYLVQLAADDWGLWRTTTMVAERAADFAGSLDGFERAGLVRERAARYVAAAAAAPKSRAWRLRAKVGDRKRWYELPEEEAL